MTGGYEYGASPAAALRREEAKLAALAAADAAAERSAQLEAAVAPLPKHQPRPLTLQAAARIDLSSLPEPTWGGALGLKLAAAEISDWGHRNPNHPLLKESTDS